MRGGFGPDVKAIDRALGYVFNRFAIDPERVATYGFSDGASYALSLGITNGDLFESVVALSPGGVSPGRTHGRPRIFIAHGRKDAGLPIEATSDLIVPRLRDAGYQVTFRRHGGAHEIGPGLDAALTWLAKEWGRLPPSSPEAP
jgi:predicted esterase